MTAGEHLPTPPADRNAGTAVTYLGHATVLIEARGTRLLTDPLFRLRVAHLRRLVPAPPVPRLTSADAVLISHAHFDHLDLPSLRKLPPSVPIVVPRGWAGLVRRAGLRDVAEVEVGDRLQIGPIGVMATPAEHDGRRMPLGRTADALGYLVEGPHRIYFAGDTDLFEGMRELAKELDLALLPVSGWGRRLPPGHLDPERAARAAGLLRPRLAIPIHWGTYASPRARLEGPAHPAREFARLAGSCAPDVEVRIIRPGDGLSV